MAVLGWRADNESVDFFGELRKYSVALNRVGGQREMRPVLFDRCVNADGENAAAAALEIPAALSPDARWLVNHRPLLAPDGTVHAISSMVLDVTETKSVAPPRSVIAERTLIRLPHFGQHSASSSKTR